MSKSSDRQQPLIHAQQAPVGLVYNVPLPDSGGYGLAVVACRGRKPTIKADNITPIWCFGYGPSRKTKLTNQAFDLLPKSANLIGFTTDDCILSGNWILAGEAKAFRQQESLLPRASRWDAICHRWLSYPIDYERMTHNHEDICVVTTKQASMMPETGISGGEGFGIGLDVAIQEGWRIRRPVTASCYQPKGKPLDLND